MIEVRLIVFSLGQLKVCLRIFFGLLYLPNYYYTNASLVVGQLGH